MSETAKRLFESLRQAGDGLRSVGAEALAQTRVEGSRLMTQGAMELASALFNGHAFVPYGPGQYTPDHQQEQTRNQPQLEQGRDR